MRVTKASRAGLVLVLLILAGWNLERIGLAQADCTRTVNPGDSIQRAIDNASPGEVICIRAGTYQEGINIMKPLTLRGEGRDSVVIVGSPSITNAVNVAVQSLTLQGGRGLVAVNSSNVILENLRVVESGGAGVLVSNSSVEIRQSLISANKLQGVAVSLNSSAVVASNEITQSDGDGINVAA